MFEFKDDNTILRTVVRIILPFIMVLGVFILVNGHLSPGGGFSGGTVLGAGLIMNNIAHGREFARKTFTYRTYTVISAVSLIMYGLAKGYSFIMGSQGLHTGIPIGTPGKIFSAGLIMPLNIFIGFTVAASIYLFYSIFDKGDI